MNDVNIDNSKSMNSARQMISLPIDKLIQHDISKEQSTEESRQGTNNNEILLQENITLTRQLRDLNEKFAQQREVLNAKSSNNNTSSKQFLPSEFGNEWESISKDTISDFFIDFFEYPYMVINLIQELFAITKTLVEQSIEEYINRMMNALRLDLNVANKVYMTEIIHIIIKDFYEEIFDSEKHDTKFYERFVLKYRRYYLKIFNHVKEKEFNELLSEINCEALRKLLKKIRKMIVFVYLNNDTIVFEIENHHNRQLDIIDMELSQCDVVPGVTSKNKKDMIHCCILLYPPKLINRKSYYRNLKPIVMKIDKQYTIDKEMEVFFSKSEIKGKCYKKTNDNNNNNDDNNTLQERLLTEIQQELPKRIAIKKKYSYKKYNYSPREYSVYAHVQANNISLSKHKVYHAIKVFDTKINQMNKKSKYSDYMKKATMKHSECMKGTSINSSINESNPKNGFITERRSSNSICSRKKFELGFKLINKKK